MEFLRQTSLPPFKKLLLIVGSLVVAQQLSAAPYPPDGMKVEWTQPDGTVLNLRVFGDEFYARTTTEDGRTVIFDHEANAYFYARLSADETALESTGIVASNTAPATLRNGSNKPVILPSTEIAKIREEKVERMFPNSREEWAKRVAASRQRKGQSTPSDAQGEGSSSASPSEDSEGPEPAVTGSQVGLTILVQFPDDPQTGGADPVNFPTSQAKVERYCNEIGYTDDGNTGSVRDYFFEQSLGAVTYTQQVTAIVTLPNPRDWYNFDDHPTNLSLRDSGEAGRLVVRHAVAVLESQGYNFSTLTLGPSNRIVATNILFAGATSGVWSEGLWPHRWVIDSGGINVGTAQSPRYVYDYQITNAETAAITIGTFCHENGHLLLKLPDLYDYGGESAGVGRHGLMGSGNHVDGGRTPAPLNAYFKDVSGWMTVTDITASTSVTATLQTNTNEAYRIRKPGSSSEYFIIENRGTGDPWADHVPDKGIMIWHIDEAENGNNNEQMTSDLHYEVSIEQADGLFDLENNRDRGDSADMFDVSDPDFSDTTLPDAKWWNGSNSGIDIEVLDPPGQSMRVKFGGQPPNTITIQSPISTTQMATAEPNSIDWVGTFTANVRIELLKGGVLHTVITSNTANDGNFLWTPPTTLTSDTDYSIRIEHVSNASIFAESANFEIRNILFFDDFESGTFSPDWTVTGTGNHRTIVTQNNGPYAGSWHVTMDSTTSGSYVRNELTLDANLLLKENVKLEFYAREFADEAHYPPTNPFTGGANFDGVAISSDGIVRYEVQPLRFEIFSIWQRFTVDIDSALATYGLPRSGNFKIRFNHYGNSPISGDGFAFDDILVMGDEFPPSPSTIDMSSSSDTGSSNTDNITKERRPYFSGTTDPGIVVNLVSNLSGLLGSAVSDGSGDWTIQASSNLPHGTHQISASGEATSSPLSVTIDLQSPTSTIDLAPGQNDPAPAGPVYFSVTFDEPVTGFTSGDVSASGTSVGSAVVSGGPSVYTVSVPTNETEGFVQISITDAIAQDLAGNLNQTPQIIDKNVFLDAHGDDRQSGTPLIFSEDSTDGSGWLTQNDTDFFEFTLTSSKTVEIFTTGSLDTVGTLRSDYGTVLNDPVADDDSGAGNNFRTSLILVAGTYTIEVANGSSAQLGEYDLFINLSGVPVLINEIDSLTFGGDTAEFIELFDGGEGNRSLDGRVLVFITGEDQTVVDTIDLDGYTTNSDGFFLIANASIPGADMVIPDTSIENGYDAVGFYSGTPSDFPVGSNLTTNNLIDAVVYLADETAADDLLLPLLLTDEEEVDEAENEFANGQSLQRIPDGQGGPRSTSGFLAAAPTPGLPNRLPPAPFTIDLLPTSDTGNSSSDNVTRDRRPLLSGTATPGSIVRLASNRHGTLGIVQTSPDGSFAFPQPSFDLSVSIHTFAVYTESTGQKGPELPVTIDTTPPTVTVEKGPLQEDPVTSGPLSFVATFDGPVVGFDSSDVSTSGYGAGAISVSGGPLSYDITVETSGEEGNVTVFLSEGAVFDLAGNPNVASTSVDNSVSLDFFDDYTSGNVTPLALESGIINLTGWVQSDDRDAFSFTIDKPKLAVIQTTGGVDTLGAIYTADGTRLNTPGFDDNDGENMNFLISVPLAAGEYFVEVYSQGIFGTGQYFLTIDASMAPYVQPDLMVSSPLDTASPEGDDIYDTYNGQEFTVSSRRASAVAGRFQLQNDGEVPDNFLLSASRGNSTYSVRYTTWKDGNITAGLIAGTHTESGIEIGEESPTIVAVVQPNIRAVRKIKKKKKRNGKKKKKVIWLSRTGFFNLSATSDASDEKRDVARIVVRSY